jgi:hypothetical protein
MNSLKNKKMILTAVVLLFVAAGIFAAVKLLWKEDARELYFKAESNNFKKVSQWLNKNYTLLQETQKPYKTTPYKRRLELTADVSSGGKPFGMGNADRLYNLIKRSKLVVDTQRQPLEDTAVSNVTLLLERVPFIDTTAFTKAGTLYFTIPVLMPDKYFSANINKLDEVYERFSLPVRPKRLVNAADIAQTLKFGEPSFDESAKRLGSVFPGLIGKDSVKFGGTRELTISGQVYKGREILVSLNAAAAAKLISGLFSSASSDDALIAFTYGNFADLSTMLDDAGLFRLSEYLDQTGTVVLSGAEKKFAEMLNVRKNTEAFRISLKNAFERYTVKNGLEMAVVIDNAGNILDRRLTIDLAAKDGTEDIKADVHTGSSNAVFEDCRNRFITFTLTQKTAEGSMVKEFSMTPDFAKPNGTNTKGKIALSYAATSSDAVKSGMDIKLDFTGMTDEKSLKRNDIFGFQVKMFSGTGRMGEQLTQSTTSPDPASALKTDGFIDGELSKFSWDNKKSNTKSQTVKLSVKADLPSFGVKDLSAVINLAGEDKLGIEPIVLPDVQQDKITDLNTVSDAELGRIEQEALSSFGTFYFTNKPVFDAILGK